ncbi:MAG: hypothetical protein HC913_02960 [Microscillaceae bacterium]|nr:hypothetical protein [Microscillaceae bacterium]
MPQPVYLAQLAENPAENTRIEKLLLGLGAEAKTDAQHQVVYDLERLNLELGLLNRP